MNLNFLWLFLISVIVQNSLVHGWDNEELEIFDLVEEIGVEKSFYKVLNVEQSASLSEIKRAFRNLSVVLHPDKNDAEDANVQFRNLVSVYDVLKDTSKREKYDKVLRDGLPNWKSALYYYRRMRKMSIAEAVAIFFVIVTIAQYLFAWAAYVEKKYTAEQVFGSRLKKMQKKNKTSVGIDAIINEIPKPSVINTLPFQIPIGLYNLVVHGPKNLKNLIKELAEQKKRELQRQKEEKEEQERLQKLEEERQKMREEIKLKKRKNAQNVPQKSPEELASYSVSAVKDENSDENSLRRTNKPISGGLWTDDDLQELVRLVKKYPGGTANRWEVIADMMNRSVYDVTHMAAKLKETAYKVPGQPESPAEQILQEATKNKVKTRKVADVQAESVWTQEQQKALEAAIIKHPKSAVGDRWEKIASSVPGKTKEECLARYKYLVDFNTLPFQIPIGLYNLVVHGPKNLKNLIKELAEQKKRELQRQKEEKEEQERLQKLEEERQKMREEIKLKKRKNAQNVPQKSPEELASYSVSAVKDENSDENSLRRTNKPISGGLWTDDDLQELVRLVKKYPGGTANRWEVIADMMNRSVYDVTHMAAKLKETAYKVPGQPESPAEQILQEATKNKIKTRKVADVQAESVWTQEQQKALEAAIIKYPKSAVGDRWEKIASSVPGKTKEECLARYKYLVDFVKKQKQQNDQQETEKEPPQEQEKEKEEKTIPEIAETSDIDSQNQKPDKKSKKKKKPNKKESEDEQEAEIVDFEEYEESPAPQSKSGGKAKNKRKARKKDFEISYDDYQDSEDEDDDN
uniref:CSON000418 protein n=1 Tax=Culicoides sonorensis TaxID=179676 RepID=A0A336MK67_CULSO